MPRRRCKSLSKYLFTSSTPSCQLCRCCQAAQIYSPFWGKFSFEHNPYLRKHHFSQNRPTIVYSVSTSLSSVIVKSWLVVALKRIWIWVHVCVCVYCICHSVRPSLFNYINNAKNVYGRIYYYIYYLTLVLFKHVLPFVHPHYHLLSEWGQDRLQKELKESLPYEEMLYV